MCAGRSLALLFEVSNLCDLSFAEFGSRCVFEPVLDHHTIVDIEGGPAVASAVSNPVAPDHNKPIISRRILRDFSFTASAGSIIGCTRDPFHSSSKQNRGNREQRMLSLCAQTRKVDTVFNVKWLEVRVGDVAREPGQTAFVW